MLLMTKPLPSLKWLTVDRYIQLCIRVFCFCDLDIRTISTACATRFSGLVGCGLLSPPMSYIPPFPYFSVPLRPSLVLYSRNFAYSSRGWLFSSWKGSSKALPNPGFAGAWMCSLLFVPFLLLYLCIFLHCSLVCVQNLLSSDDGPERPYFGLDGSIPLVEKFFKVFLRIWVNTLQKGAGLVETFGTLCDCAMHTPLHQNSAIIYADHLLRNVALELNSDSTAASNTAFMSIFSTVWPPRWRITWWSHFLNPRLKPTRLMILRLQPVAPVQGWLIFWTCHSLQLAQRCSMMCQLLNWCTLVVALVWWNTLRNGLRWSADRDCVEHVLALNVWVP